MTQIHKDVPLVDLCAQSDELHDELRGVFESVLSRAAYTLGPELAGFESEFAAFCRVEHCAGVSSGTAAVRLALQAAGIGPGDEVILPVNTFIATAEAVTHCGATPVFVDCLPGTANIDPARIADAVTARTAAVLPVHLYGQPADMESVLRIASERGLAVVEDACQAHGARFQGRPCGSLGITAAFSFYPGKNLGALGDGGAVTTNDASADRRVRLLRSHGEGAKSVHELVGYCDRLHNLQAGFLAVKLASLGAWNDLRRAAAHRYDQLLAQHPGVAPLEVREDVEHVYHLYVVQVDDRDVVRERMRARGVQTGVHYPVPLHLTRAYSGSGHGPGDFPVAERLASRIVSLPMYPHLTAEQQIHVATALEHATS